MASKIVDLLLILSIVGLMFYKGIDHVYILLLVSNIISVKLYYRILELKKIIGSEDDK